MERVGRGEFSALDVLYARYQKRLLFYFHRMLSGDVVRAQDMLHDLFLKLIERPELYTPGKPLSTWIFSIAHNMCKNEYRKKYSTRSSAMASLDADIDIETIESKMLDAADAFDRATFAAMLRIELDLLDPDAKTTFLLRHQEGFSVRDIAETLGCPEGTVKSRLYNTTRKLAERLRVFNPIEHHE